MKKTLLTLAALALTMAVGAQVVKAPVAAQKPQKALITPPSKVAKAPRKVDLAANQRIAGYYTTDDLAQYGLGTPGFPGDNAAGVILNRTILNKYVGAKIVGIRIGLCAAVATRAFVAPVYSQYFGNDTISIDFDSQTGWNEIDVPDSQQYVINNDVAGLLVGFEYAQSSNSNANEAYPLSLVEAGDTYTDLLIYCNVPASSGGQGRGWYDFGNSYGNMSVQLIVESNSFPSSDITLGNLSTNIQYYARGGEVTWTAKVSNFGSSEANYALNVKLDGEQKAVYTSSSAVAISGTENITGTVTLPDDISLGSHQLSLEVASINGETPTQNLADDTVATSFSVYAESVPRQKQLVEHFTSQSCTFCPLGDELLETVEGLRDDVARVSIHGNMNAVDPFNTAKCDTIQSWIGLGSWPTAAFNRTFIPDLAQSDGEIVYGIGYYEQYIPQYAPFFSQFIDGTAEAPSFVGLTIDQNWDKVTRELTVTVTGEGVSDAAQYLDNAALTVYLTEDSLIASQLNQGTWVNNFQHDNVMRDVLTSTQGNRIHWDGDSFTQTFTTTVPDTWNENHMNVVALVAPFVDFSNLDRTRLAVNNCEKASVAQAVADGIADIKATHDSQLVRARYNAAGQRIEGEQHGLNIIQLANGQTVKVLVR